MAERDEPAEQSKKADTASIRDRNRRIREEAAEKRRRNRAGAARTLPDRNLDAGEIVDDALARSTHAAVSWVRRNANVIQWIVVIGIVGGIGYKIYAYRHARNMEAATAALEKALQAELGRVGSKSAPPADEITGLGDPRPAFPSEEARLKEALERYREATNQKGAAGELARLGMAGVLFDMKKFGAAREAYRAVKASKLGDVDRDAHARAIEGIGLTLEAEDKLDEATTAFRELENTDIPGLSALGLYHQARLLLKKGERDQAKEKLKKALEKLKPSDKDKDKAVQAGPTSFVEMQVQELLTSIDPSAVRQGPASLTPAQLQMLQEKLKGGGGKLDASQLEQMLKQIGEKPAVPPGGEPSGEPEAPSEDEPTGKAPTEDAPSEEAPKAPAMPAPAGSSP